MDHLQISSYYETVEISVLSHYQPAFIQNIKNFANFIQLSVAVKSAIRQILDSAASIFPKYFHGLRVEPNVDLFSFT